MAVTAVGEGEGGLELLRVTYSGPLVVPHHHLHLLVLALTAAILLLGLLLAIYRRWHQVTIYPSAKDD